MKEFKELFSKLCEEAPDGFDLGFSDRKEVEPGHTWGLVEEVDSDDDSVVLRLIATGCEKGIKGLDRLGLLGFRVANGENFKTVTLNRVLPIKLIHLR